MYNKWRLSITFYPILARVARSPKVIDIPLVGNEIDFATGNAGQRKARRQPALILPSGSKAALLIFCNIRIICLKSVYLTKIGIDKSPRSG
jgi:hypothetical protein